MDISFVPTLDCEPPKPEISAHANEKSPTGPESYAASERSIRGYVNAVDRYGFTATLFVHPQVAEQHRDLFLDLRERGVCLGLHLHPYKLNDSYRRDFGAYPHSTQKKILTEAVEKWEEALGQPPRYFRPGVFSANDSTFSLLAELGFEGGSVSSPGRVLPSSAAVWAGAELDPHRAHRAFRQRAGDLDFANVPVTVDVSGSMDGGHLGQDGYPSLYLSPADEEELNPDATGYDFDAIIRNVAERFERDAPEHPAFVTNTHNNMDYGDETHPARRNLETVLEGVNAVASERGHTVNGETVESISRAVRSGEGE